MLYIMDTINRGTDVATDGLKKKLVECVGSNYTATPPCNMSSCDELCLQPQKAYLAYKERSVQAAKQLRKKR